MDTPASFEDTPSPRPPSGGREPVRDVGDVVSAIQLSSAAFHGVAQRAEQHLERLVAALPWGIAVVRGDHVLLSNATASARLPGSVAGTFSLADAARMAEEAPVIVPAANGLTVRVSTRPLEWDHSQCRLLIVEPYPPEAVPTPPTRDAEPTTSVVASDTPAHETLTPTPPSVPTEAWSPLADLAGGRMAGAVLHLPAESDEPSVQRSLVRAIGALAEWGRGRTALETPVTVVALPRDHVIDMGFVAFVDAVLRRAAPHPQRLWTLVSRSAIDTEHATQALAALRRLGPRVMVDGFAHADDSVAHVASRPIDGVRLAVETLASGDWSLIHSALSIARHHGLATMASGVADETTHERLRAVGCRWAEGSAYGSALSRADVASRGGRPLRARG